MMSPVMSPPLIKTQKRFKTNGFSRFWLDERVMSPVAINLMSPVMSPIALESRFAYKTPGFLRFGLDEPVMSPPLIETQKRFKTNGFSRFWLDEPCFQQKSVLFRMLLLFMFDQREEDSILDSMSLPH